MQRAAEDSEYEIAGGYEGLPAEARLPFLVFVDLKEPYIYCSTCQPRHHGAGEGGWIGRREWREGGRRGEGFIGLDNGMEHSHDGVSVLLNAKIGICYFE